jgi:hypothetical protein
VHPCVQCWAAARWQVAGRGSGPAHLFALVQQALAATGDLVQLIDDDSIGVVKRGAGDRHH